MTNVNQNGMIRIGSALVNFAAEKTASKSRGAKFCSVIKWVVMLSVILFGGSLFAASLPEWVVGVWNGRLTDYEQDRGEQESFEGDLSLIIAQDGTASCSVSFDDGEKCSYVLEDVNITTQDANQCTITFWHWDDEREDKFNGTCNFVRGGTSSFVSVKSDDYSESRIEGSVTKLEKKSDGEYIETIEGQEWRYKVVDGQAEIQSGPGSGAVEIPAVLSGCPVTSIGEHAFWECSELTSVTIPSSVKTIGTDAFSGCSNISSVVVPGWKCGIDFTSVTNLVISDGTIVIGRDAFWGCSELISVKIPASVTSVGWGAFNGCSGLTSLTVPEGVMEIQSSAFENCSALTTVKIPESVTEIGKYAFKGCLALESVTIPLSVKNIEDDAFENCDALKTIYVRDGDIERVAGLYSWPQSIEIRINGSDEEPRSEVVHGIEWQFKVVGNESVVVGVADDIVGGVMVPSLLGECMVTRIEDDAFFGYNEITSVEIPSSVTSIGETAFGYCNGLKSVTIPEGVRDIGNGAFEGCDGLTSVAIPLSVTNIGEAAFCDCSRLTSAVIPSSVRSINDWTFRGCSCLTSVTISAGVTSIGGDAFYGCGGLMSVTIPSTVTSIGDHAFEDCCSLSSVTIPSSVTSIGCGAFDNCYSLSNVTVPGWKCEIEFSAVTNLIISEGTTNIESWAFEECDSLASVTILPGLMSIGKGAFSGCSKLSSLKIPLSVTSIGSSAFAGCSSLGDGVIIVGGCVLTVNGLCPECVDLCDGVRLIAGCAFNGCSELKSVTIPSSVTSIGDQAFYGCSGLTILEIPSGVTSIGWDAFGGCYGLRDVTVPGWKCEIDFSAITNLIISAGTTSIADYAFEDCCSLASVTIPLSVTNIGERAFNNCSGLLSVVIPSSVTSIGCGAFDDCSSLMSVVISAGVTNIGTDAFFGCTSLKSVGVPSSVISIGDAAFGGCNNLLSVDFEGAPPMGITDAGIDSEVAIRYNAAYEAEWLPVISACGFTNAKAYVPGQGSKDDDTLSVSFVTPNGETSTLCACFATNGVYGLLPEARREGFTFAGWYTSLEGNVRVTAFSRVDPSNTTLYARWVEDDAVLYAQWEANRYSVRFEANGGEGTMGDQAFLYDQLQNLNAPVFTRTGYTFKGWSMTENGEVVYKDGECVSNLTSVAGFAVALFAQWEKDFELNAEEIEDWLIDDLAPKFAAKSGESESSYRKRFKEKFGADYAAAFYKETGKIGQDGTKLQVWHDYMAGTDPLDLTSQFKASITFDENGTPIVEWSPDLNDDGKKSVRKYTTYGCENLDGNWHDMSTVPEADKSNYRFFKVTVEMP